MKPGKETTPGKKITDKMKSLNSMKRKYLLLALLVAAVTLAKGQNTKLTLKDCIDTALKNNITVRQSEILMNNAKLGYNQSKYNLLPNVASSFSYGVNNGRSINPATNGYINQQLQGSSVDAQTSIPLFNGFRLRNTIKQNELAFAGATMEWQQRKDELTLQVILAYLQVLNDSDAITLARQQATITKQQVDRLAVINEEGATPPGNFSDLKGQYAGELLAVTNAENSYAESALTLTQLMNIPYSTQLEFDKTGLMEEVSPFTTLPEDIYNIALQKLATVRASELRISSSTAAIKAAAGNYFPSISLYGGASTNYSSAAQLSKVISSSYVPNGSYVPIGGTNVDVYSKQDVVSNSAIGYGNQIKNNISTFFGVSMQIPVFNNFRTRTNVKLARNDERNYKLIAEGIKLQLRQGIDRGYVNINAVYRRYLALKEQANAYGESFRIASVRFENGVINSPEYLIAKNNLDRANANIIIAEYEYLLRKKILDFYMGTLN
jgi:outer membrane protein